MSRCTAWLLLAALGCGGGDDTPAADSDPGGGGGTTAPLVRPDGAPSCGPDEFAVVGDAAGMAVDHRAPDIGTYVFTNALGTQIGSLDMRGPNGALLLEWEELVADGGAVEARGLVDLSMRSDLNFVLGNCMESGHLPGAMFLDDDGGGGVFVIKDLVANANCDLVDQTGELLGCFRGG